jgi:hypothetical protein
MLFIHISLLCNIVMPVQQANYADVVGANEKDMKNFVL